MQQIAKNTVKKSLDSLEKPSPMVELIIDKTPVLGVWAYHLLGLKIDPQQVFFSWGIVYQGRLIGVIVWTDLRPAHDVWWTIVTWDKHWCTKGILRHIFVIAKHQFHLERINALVKTVNTKAIKLLTRLGFQKEGHLKRFYDDKSDAFLFAKYLF